MMRARGLVKLAANATSANFTAKTAMRTAEPTGNLVIRLSDVFGGVVPSHARFFPYGLGSDNDVFSLRLWGWTRYHTVTTKVLYLPTMLMEVSCTVSTFVGVAGRDVLNTERFADTISIVATVGQPTVSADVTPSGTLVLYSPANDTPGWVQTCLYGSEFLELDFDQTTGTPEMNTLIQFLDEVGE